MHSVEVTQFIFAGVGAFIFLVLGVAVSIRMKRIPFASRNIFYHVVRLVSFCLLVLMINFAASLAIDVYNLTYIKPVVLQVFTDLIISFLFMRELFQLINRLTHSQIAKGGDPTSARAISRSLKLASICVLVLVFGEHFGIGMSGILAFGGIGGIAVGLASKDFLSNIFSGIMLFFDRPFKIGDWVSSPDRQIEGTVVEIGWRITQIRTFENRPLYVPNAAFSSISVENPGEMTNRRIETTIGLRYDDTGRIKLIVDEIKTYLKANSDIDQNQTMLVAFNGFGSSSVNILVYCFTRTTNWAEWLRVQQLVFLELIEIVHKHEADFAFPTQTVLIDGGAAQPNACIKATGQQATA